MIETPRIVQSAAQATAVVRLTVPRSEIQSVMGPAITEVIGAVQAQGLGPVGPVFSLHHKMDPEVFDFEVGVPVSGKLAPIGRVEPSQIPAAKVARSIYRGGYEGLGPAWGEFEKWLADNGHKPLANLWEFYTIGPESGPDPTQWATELNRPLA